MPLCAALIVAAGRGERFGNEVPKQYLPLAGAPVLRHSAATFTANPGIGAVRVVIHEDDRERYAEAVAGLDLLAPVTGGATRRESVRLGLESLAELAPDRVLIHDAARPFVDTATIARVIAALEHATGAIAAVPLRDTLKRGDDGRIMETVPRQGLWRAQTPQAFRFADILAAHRAFAAGEPGAEPTDDAAIAERAGLTVSLVAGSEENFKLTTQEDLERAERLLGAAKGDVRTGLGFDVHGFGDGRDGRQHLMLCGVKVPHDATLTGHSDADVGLHALTDALLGAIGAGDIGEHFAPDDPKWRGADSAIFLRHAVELIADRGGEIGHVDITLICQKPKIGPHRADMRARIAGLLGIAADKVNVKATTTDGLGFLGRGEGIAAQAVATVRLASE
ncbi:MAG: bifunctional 2-C-methyl-D-erythritol 4-phosphate cytidylyltransferase/2-C-methyl-D-erythritol 2,4-cyclodiphosphate synthase [Proteobacteria bacterium]|nr:bifunctional 2-C-methyl-D-erythritol 4-phosphate cytidylyltransferase/2-C-methyl-D-erythritol 2,4-cyclodiphosphate synthase [Pseudomonadota bacterium]